ncbi:MAG: hypothetical protein E2598_03755 [Sphingobium sp.]|nr:hypothetical protein [Sphingobium sp.]
MKTLSFVIAAVVATTTLPAMAQSPAKLSPVDAALLKFDKNKDGFVTKAELPAKHPLLDHFDMADKDRDGKLNKRELGIALKML